MNNGKSTPTKCSSCGAIQNKTVTVKAEDGRIFNVCSDTCSKKICDMLASDSQKPGRFAADESRIAMETDRLLRDLGIA